MLTMYVATHGATETGTHGCSPQCHTCYSPDMSQHMSMANRSTFQVGIGDAADSSSCWLHGPPRVH